MSDYNDCMACHFGHAQHCEHGKETDQMQERITALEARTEQAEHDLAEDQAEHDKLMAYVKQIKPDAHSVYEVLDLLKARCAQAERELASTKVSLAETTQSHHQLAKELREERALPPAPERKPKK